MKLKDIADSFELQTIGNVDKEISGLASLEKAGPDDLAFLFSRSHRESLVSSEAGAFVLKKEDKFITETIFTHKKSILESVKKDFSF